MSNYQSKSELDHIIQNYLIFVDSSSLMKLSAHSFFNKKLVPKIKKHNANKNEHEKQGIYIIRRVIDELERFINEDSWKKDLTSKEISDKQYAAKAGKSLVSKLEQEKIAYLGNERKGGHADNDFLVFFTEFTPKNNLCLITQDTGLALDVLDLGNRRSSHSKNIKALRINKIGYNNFSKHTSTRFVKTRPNYKTVKPFRKSDRLEVAIGSNALATSINPQSGDYVFDNTGSKIKLKKQLNEGGEGIIYNSGRGVCKIYKSDIINDLRIKKLKLMQSNQLKIPGVIWPRSILYNLDKQPVGYLMREVKSNTQIKFVDMQ